jgi:hypothetical protein
MEQRIGVVESEQDYRFRDLEKQHIEILYQEEALDKLKKRLKQVTFIPKVTADLGYGKWIKEKTGYDIDVFEKIPKRIHKIIERKKINNRGEFHDTITMIALCRKTSIGKEHQVSLKNLMRDFKPPSGPITVNHLAEISSKDNQSYITIDEVSLEQNLPQTQVSVHIGDMTGSFYAVEGINLGVHAYWKDNNTVVVETRKGYKEQMKGGHRPFEHNGIVINIEYVER